eukprot:TRINITY_DN13425_c0_g1_i1.p1 TRINITY_DN13425_c0_g1~~TRINITY_DN13425_c0_g1_i1.p1  ORF type:complete len:160 (-),score=20.04 TRINITY_DN13425_c0_g1_i1:512-964(-)
MTPLSAPVKLASSPFFQGATLSCSSFSSAKPMLMPGYSLQVEALKKVQGKVVNAVNDKTVAVEVFRIAKHPKYGKRIKTSKKYQAHDPNNVCKVGDTVTLVKCAPVSKKKTFVVTEIRPAKLAVRRTAAPAAELSIPFESTSAPAAPAGN